MGRSLTRAPVLVGAGWVGEPPSRNGLLELSDPRGEAVADACLGAMVLPKCVLRPVSSAGSGAFMGSMRWACAYNVRISYRLNATLDLLSAYLLRAYAGHVEIAYSLSS